VGRKALWKKGKGEEGGTEKVEVGRPHVRGGPLQKRRNSTRAAFGDIL